MDKFFTRFLLLYRNILSGLLIALSATAVQAQDPTFFENFDDTPLGEIPDGWKSYSLGGSQGNNWVRSTYGFFGPKVMTSGVEMAFPGQIDEDWLVTPKITPAENDYLIFDSGQEYVWDDFGSTFEIRISTKTSNRPDFTTVIASYTETEFPGYLYHQPLLIDLSAYSGKPVYIAFIHKNPVTGEGSEETPPSENWYLDNVTIRNVRNMDYSGAEIRGSYKSVIRTVQSKTTVIIEFVVRASGDNGDANISSMKFSTAGTSSLLHIKEAIVYTTYADAFIATDENEGVVWADVYGSVTDPGDEFVVEGNQMLERGDTYFWLMYTIEANEADLTYPYPQTDATFDKVIVNGVEHETDVPSTDGSHSVVPDVPVNDHYANSIEIAPTYSKTRYGSYNYKATYEADFEKLAYCATPIYQSAMDGSNSVWWHFHAPSDGVITVDLSQCDFNTLLLIQDENYDQLACNKDIDEAAFVFQSKITDFVVEEGKDYYIRVTGEGFYPGDPNAESGVVHMDFSFAIPLGEEGNFDQQLSSLYPNPTEGLVYADVFLKRPGIVTLDVVDLMGRTTYSQNNGMLSAGKHEHLPVDVSALPAGTYFVRLRGNQSATIQKLIILKR